MMKDQKSEDGKAGVEINPQCGIVMPISPIDGCSAAHWKEVYTIIEEPIKKLGFNPNMVSITAESSVIQHTIVTNLYNNDIVVCDVSGNNPNVMFELGMRLAFDKPAILIKDDKTDFSFDTSIIEHVDYPRDLSYFSILGFKERLRNKIKATYDASKESGYSTFLNKIGNFLLPQLKAADSSIENILPLLLQEIKSESASLKLFLGNSLGNNVEKSDFRFNYKENLVEALFWSYLHKKGIHISSMTMSASEQDAALQYINSALIAADCPLDFMSIRKKISALCSR